MRESYLRRLTLLCSDVRALYKQKNRAAGVRPWIHCLLLIVISASLASCKGPSSDHAHDEGESHGHTSTHQKLSTQDLTNITDYSLTEQDKQLLGLFGPWPLPIPLDPGNELSGLSWAESLGKVLFNDPDMSVNSKFSCASCHIQELGFGDNLVVAQGLAAHTRNSQGLLNVGFQRWFGWDGGADSIWAASLRPLLADVEMGESIAGVARKFRNKDYVMSAFNSAPEIQIPESLSDEQFVVLLSKAIAAYTRTLISGVTPFDRYRIAVLENNVDQQALYPESAKRGLKTFFGQANCHVCHFGPNFSNGEFHDIGRPFFTDVGQVDGGRYDGIKRVKQDPYNLLSEYNKTDDEQGRRKTRTVSLGQINFGQWKTPSLRNLTVTAPYMHDGSLKTLRDVVDSYADIDPHRLHAEGESILKPLDLDDQARNDLVSFLQSLSE